MKTVKTIMVARKSANSFLYSFLLFVIGLGIAIFAVADILPRDLKFWIATTAGMPLFFYLATESLTQQIKLTRTSISCKSVFRKRELNWSKVSSIMHGGSVAFMPVKVSGFYVVADDGKIGVATNLFRNGTEFAKATIETAKSANPKIQVDPELFSIYGYPPVSQDI